MPDHWAATDTIDADRPLRLVTPPSRTYLNTSFSKLPGSRKREAGQPLSFILGMLLNSSQTAGKSGLAIEKARSVSTLRFPMPRNPVSSSLKAFGRTTPSRRNRNKIFLIDATPVPPAGGALSRHGHLAQSRGRRNRGCGGLGNLSETAWHNPTYLLIPAAFVLLWGSGFIAAETGLGHADTPTFLRLRYGVVTVLTGIVAIAMRANTSTSEILAARCGICVGTTKLNSCPSMAGSTQTA